MDFIDSRGSIENFRIYFPGSFANIRLKNEKASYSPQSHDQYGVNFVTVSTLDTGHPPLLLLFAESYEALYSQSVVYNYELMIFGVRVYYG